MDVRYRLSVARHQLWLFWSRLLRSFPILGLLRGIAMREERIELEIQDDAAYRQLMFSLGEGEQTGHLAGLFVGGGALVATDRSLFQIHLITWGVIFILDWAGATIAVSMYERRHGEKEHVSKFLSKLVGESDDEDDDTTDDAQQALDAELHRWRIITVENKDEDFLMIFRIRIERPELPNIDDFETAISISWPYESESHVPDSETAAEMRDYEGLIDELSEDTDFSYLIQVTTGMGERQWLYYTADQERFMSTFNELLADAEPRPLEIEFLQDPAWDLWRDSIDSIAQKEPGAFS